MRSRVRVYQYVSATQSGGDARIPPLHHNRSHVTKVEGRQYW